MSNMPNLGSRVPDFISNSTVGKIKLSGYCGKWIILFTTQFGFSPVCTTELIEFANLENDFNKRNAKLIAISNDSNSSQLSWICDIKTKLGVEIDFPIVEDRDFRITRSYGMMSNPNNISPSRTLFIIDDKQILRTILCYPASVGRNITEILRILDGLQIHDKNNVLIPADWMPGDSVVTANPQNLEELLEDIKTDKNEPWYLHYIQFFESDDNFKVYNKSPKHKSPSKPEIDCMEYELFNNLDDELTYNQYNVKNNFSFDKDIKKIAKKALKDYSDKKYNRPQISSLLNEANNNSQCPDLNRVVAEYVFGNPKNFDPNLIDVAIYAFVEIGENGTLVVPTPSYLREMVNFKESKPSLRVVAAIGGWGADGFSNAALTPESRYNFAREANKLIKEYNLDGIDIDWEYPGTSAAGIISRPEDKENFTLLLTALRDVIGNNRWLSVAGTGEKAYLNQSIEAEKIAPIITHFNLMSYDFTAGETGENAKKHHANLYPSSLALSGYSVDTMVNDLIAAGMPPEKILLGIPFYGRLGATLTKSYDQLRKDYLNNSDYVYNFDKDAFAPYLTKDGEFAMSFEDPLSVFLKTQYVIEKCLGGVFSWTSTYDQANILANVMHNGIVDAETTGNEIKTTYSNYI